MDATRNLLAISILILSGCNTLRGAPPTPFTARDVWSPDAVKLMVTNLAAPSANVHDDTDQSCTKLRDSNASQLIAYVDVNYMSYRQSFVFDRQHTNAISDGLQLAMTIAGGLTTSAGVKDNYLAGIGLLTGGEAIYDKTYLFEKTAPALVSQMDASRKLRLGELSAKLMELGCASYPGRVALADIMDYYYRGTVVGAISATQKDAEAKDVRAQEVLNRLNRLNQQRMNVTDGLPDSP